MSYIMHYEGRFCDILSKSNFKDLEEENSEF